MQSVVNAAEKAKDHGIDLAKLPQNVNMTAGTITQNVLAMNANCGSYKWLNYDLFKFSC